MRALVAKAGMRGWVASMDSYPLPAGLVEREEVRVVATWVEPPCMARVRTRDGREFELYHWLVDVGREINVPGIGHLPERDERAVMYLARELERLRQGGAWWMVTYGPELRRTWAWMLRRNGWDPGGDEDLQPRDRGLGRPVEIRYGPEAL